MTRLGTGDEPALGDDLEVPQIRGGARLVNEVSVSLNLLVLTEHRFMRAASFGSVVMAREGLAITLARFDRAGMGDLRAHSDPGSPHSYGCSRLPVWWRRARIAAWTRSCRPSLARMLLTWVLTVCSPIAMFRAICRLL